MNSTRVLQYIPLVVFLVIASFFINQPPSAYAQEERFLSAENALENALKEYLQLIGESSEWKLGTVKASGSFAISIARPVDFQGSYEGYVPLLAQKGTDGFWTGAAPKILTASEFNKILKSFPSSILNEFEKSYYYQYSPSEISLLMARAVSLHHFPWPIRQTARLTQKDSTYHVNQVDFVLRDSNDVYASKPGIVIFVKESSSNGGCDIDLWPYANFVVVQHSTSEYSWYVHLAKNSVPVEVGDLIGYGTKIGEQGNTGFACGSSGIHLHYMASTAIPASWPDPTVPNYAPWPPGGSIVTVDFIESEWSALVVDRVYESQNAPPPGLCGSTVSQAIFYDNTYCNGQIFQQAGEGLIELELAALDDRIESIALPSGWSLALYKDENELGPALCLNQTDQMLWDNLFGDGSVVANRISWVRVYKQPGCPYPDNQGIKFFPQPNFVGIPVWGMNGARFTNGPSEFVGSIYIPDGYSAKIYDFDDAAGNSVCLSSSVLDLSSYGWTNHKVESVDLIQGNGCESQPGDIPQPILTTPLNSSTVYGSLPPELCWQMEGDPQGYAYNVHVFSDALSLQSGWIIDKCWRLDSLVGKYGNYSWRVQAKNTEGTLSQWSLTNQFSYVADTIAPTAQMLTPVVNDTVKWPKANIIVNALDNQSGVARVHFFAWYDDGSGAGYDWHYLDLDESPDDGWRTVWNLTVVNSNEAAVWVYVEDFGGNFGSAYTSGISIVDTIINEDGFGYRGTKGTISPPGLENLTESQIDNSHQIFMPPASPFDPLPQSNDGGLALQNTESNGSVSSVSRPLIAESAQEFYGPSTPELCWEKIEGNNVRYRVEIVGEQSIVSPWVESSCWQPETLYGQIGSFEWRVRAQTDNGSKSPWSNTSSFWFKPDETPPTIQVFSPAFGDHYEGQVPIKIDAFDMESGIDSTYLLAWYDTGDGAGYVWHTIGEIKSGNGTEINFIWDVTKIHPQTILFWVYVMDNMGNLASSQVKNITLNKGSIQEVLYQKSLFEIADTTRP